MEPSIELRQLRYFVAVAEELHFGRAAERLRMSQSPLSRAIRELKRELDLVLFVRTTRRVELTAAGSVLLERYLEFEGRPHLHMAAADWQDVAAAIDSWLDGVLDAPITETEQTHA